MHDREWQVSEIPNRKKAYVALCILRALSRNDAYGDTWAKQVVGLMRRYDAEPRWLNAMGIPLHWKNQQFWRAVV